MVVFEVRVVYSSSLTNPGNIVGIPVLLLKKDTIKNECSVMKHRGEGISRRMYNCQKQSLSSVCWLLRFNRYFWKAFFTNKMVIQDKIRTRYILASVLCYCISYRKLLAVYYVKNIFYL